MALHGNCPGCGARLEIPSAPPPLLTCDACAQRCLVVLAEEDRVPISGQATLVALPPRGNSAELERRGLRRPVLVALLGAGLLGAVAFATGTLQLLAPDLGLTRGTTLAFAGLATVLVFVVPAALFLSLLVVWLLFGFRGRGLFSTRALLSTPTQSRFVFSRSAFAVAAGTVTLLGASLLLSLLGKGLRLTAESPWLLRWALPLLFATSAPLLAGLVTVRLARAEPYRHALGVGLVIAVGAALLRLGFDGAPTWNPLLSLAVLFPLLWLGAWIGVRFEAPSVRSSS